MSYLIAANYTGGSTSTSGFVIGGIFIALVLVFLFFRSRRK
jgi:LPXTG-motif cell wall-anchored protein